LVSRCAATTVDAVDKTQVQSARLVQMKWAVPTERNISSLRLQWEVTCDNDR
jgi:hypothetical protein